MRLRRDPVLKLITFYFFMAFLLTLSTAARAGNRRAEKKARAKAPPLEHVIKEGETLGAIALAHGVGLEELMEANDIDDADKIFFGQKLVLPVDPKHGVMTKRGALVTVPKGFTLSRIAAAYDVPINTIVRANKLKNPDHVRDGTKVLIPGAKRIVELVPPPPCYKDPITFYRVRTDETLKVPLLHCNGKIYADGMKKLSRFTDPPTHPIDIDLHPRLARLLYRIAERYPGKRIEVISGQRSQKQKGYESYHNKGRALDFRVQGVSNYHLSQYLRQFDSVGVGYYPNSVFVHMDTRDAQAYWIDYSAPGERAIYGRKGMTKDEIQAIRDKRRKKSRKSSDDELTAKNNKKETPRS